ncbi:MAG: hypothetical protein HF973_11855 [Chloroflexi bacterium]|nr:hypothetical protein [Chloroflexota bacterium]
MHSASPAHQFDPTPARQKFGWFLAAPVTAVLLILVLSAVLIANYQSRHQGRIFTGVMVGDVDVSQMDRVTAEEAVTEAVAYTYAETITLTDPTSGRQWQLTPADVGLAVDVPATVEAAYQTGRSGGPLQRVRDMFNGWYYGRTLAPIMVLDEAKLNEKLAEIAADVNQPAINAAVEVEGDTAVYTPGQAGRTLDTADARARLLPVLTGLQTAQIELLVNQTAPAIYDNAPGAARIQRIIDGGPVTFYLQEPLDSEDLAPVTLPPEQLRQWLRVEVTKQANGSLTHNVFLDENAARQWLAQFAGQIFREPVNARFYFDDATQELVLVSPHINGRELDIDATLEQLLAQVESPNRSVPFIVNDIVPTVNANATAAELGITELISEATTWFYGSSDARKRNISRSAANFYGIVIAPGEEFSYNKYLGTISEDDGYEEGLIIVGGQTIKGIGGGVCQVSTTVFQTVFWAGFPVTKRWEHGYMLGYYNDGEGPGMDATVYSPIVDFKFINNTPYHLLIENYYNEEEESLTFKFYSTSLGRTVEKEGPVFENIVDAPGPEEDVWTLDEDMAPGTVRQIDWATEGARVTVGRTVYNADGEVILQEDFVSNYIPWPNGYMYGPGVDAPDYSIPLED